MYFELIAPILFFSFLLSVLGFFLYWAKVQGDQELENGCKLFDGDTFSLFNSICGEPLWGSQNDASTAAVLVGFHLFTSLNAFVYTLWFQRPSREYIHRILVFSALPMVLGVAAVAWWETSTDKFKYADLIDYNFTIGPCLILAAASVNFCMGLFILFDAF